MTFEEEFPSICKDKTTNPTSWGLMKLYDSDEPMQKYMSERLLDKQRVKEVLKQLKVNLCLDQDTGKLALTDGWTNHSMTNVCQIQEDIEEAERELGLED